MKNKITFNSNISLRSQRDRIAEILALYPADLVCADGTVPDIRVISRRTPLPSSYDIAADTWKELHFDFKEYIGKNPASLISHYLSHDNKHIGLRVQRKENSITWGFTLHSTKYIDLISNGDYQINEFLMRRSQGLSS